MKKCGVLRTWADLGKLTCSARRKSRTDWLPVKRLINVAKDELKAAAAELLALLKESHRRLLPLDDPFNVDLGAHRWLAEDREEAYSDWLEWIVKQIDSPPLLCQMFALELCSASASWCSPTSVKREEVVDHGHAGHAGRLDLVVRFGKQAIIVVEVKKGSAAQADIDKYGKWLSRQPELRNYPVLLATEDIVPLPSAVEDKTDGDLNFTFVSWKHVCLFLRRLARRYTNNETCVVAALILAFVGAVEQNLLGMTAVHIRRAARGEALMFNPTIVDYLKSAISEHA